MNWEAIGAVAEMLGSIAVVLTLIYLAVQIRQNTKSNRTAALQLVSVQDSEWLSGFSQNAEFMNLWLRASAGRGDLSPEEEGRYAFALLQLFRHYDVQFHLWKEDTIPLSLWRATETGLLLTIQSPGATAWWDMSKKLFSAEFQAHVDFALSNAQQESTSAV